MQISSYRGLRDALAAQTPDIQITADITVDAQLTVSYAVTISSIPGAPFILSKNEGFQWSMFRIANGGFLTMHDIILDGKKAGRYLQNPKNRSLVIVAGGDVALHDGTILRNNSSYQEGGGLYLSGDPSYVNRLTVTGEVLVTGCESRTSGGGIMAALRNPADSVAISGMAQISQNMAANGGGVYLRPYVEDVNGMLTIGGTVQIAENNASQSGGGIFFSGYRGETERPVLLQLDENVSITGNRADNGGGIYFYGSHPQDCLRLSGNPTVSQNTAGHYGGGLSVQGSGQVKMDAGQMRHNTAALYGGGCYMQDNSLFEMTGGRITQNAAAAGGGLYNSSVATLHEEAVLDDNQADSYAPGIYNSGELALAGQRQLQNGIYLQSSAAAVSVTGVILPGSILQLDHSEYVTPNPEGQPIVIGAATQQYPLLQAVDGAAFRKPPAGFDGWEIRLNENRTAVLLAPAVYTIDYENLMGAENANPVFYTVTSPDIVLQPPGEQPGFRFMGWFDAQEGGIQTLVLPTGSTGNRKLYARWEAIWRLLTYCANDTGGPAAMLVPQPERIQEAQNHSLSSNLPIRSGYQFIGWNTEADGTGQTYWPGQTYPAGRQDTTLYAQWSPLAPHRECCIVCRCYRIGK